VAPKTFDDLSALAQRLGLSYRPSALPGHAGELNGILRGHRVLVRPDSPALYVELRFRVAGLRLSTAAPPRAARAAGMLATGQRAFERAFPWRAAPGAAGAALRAAEPFRQAALDCWRRWRGRLARLDVEPGQLCATFRRRGLLRRRAPLGAAEVEALLTELLGLAEALEAALREHALRTATGTAGTADRY
jgi:hypothetical protein